MSRRPPKTKMSRLARLGGLTSRVSTSYLGQRITGAFQDADRREEAMRRLHLKNAERVVDTMGALKGAAMKVGQQLAQVVDGMELPEEVGEILGKLNDKAEPVPFELIRRSVEHQLDAPLEDLFTEFDEEPLGTASLAQAHAARLPSGERVVVKVLHDGIEHSVDADLGALKSILVTGRVLRRDRDEIDAIFAEIRERLGEELDYYREAANLEFFRKALAGFEHVHVPATHPRYCTERVLTMDRLTGAPLDTFLQDASDEARARAGDTLIRVFHDMVYRLRALHADPHAGNYLFRADGGVGILDFGCVKRFDAYWMGDYARMARAVVFEDRPTFIGQARKLDILRSDESEAEDVLWRFAGTICSPLTVPHYACGAPDDTVTQQVQKQVPSVLRRPGIRSPRNLVFLHRSLGGTYAMLRKLEHSYDYGSLFKRHTAHAVAVAEGRVEDGSPVADA